jgi:hypothetical protein
MAARGVPSLLMDLPHRRSLMLHKMAITSPVLWVMAATTMPVCTENLDPGVVMMKSAEYRVRTKDSGALNRARDRRIFIQ